MPRIGTPYTVLASIKHVLKTIKLLFPFPNLVSIVEPKRLPWAVHAATALRSVHASAIRAIPIPTAAAIRRATSIHAVVSAVLIRTLANSAPIGGRIRGRGRGSGPRADHAVHTSVSRFSVSCGWRMRPCSNAVVPTNFLTRKLYFKESISPFLSGSIGPIIRLRWTMEAVLRASFASAAILPQTRQRIGITASWFWLYFGLF